MALIISKKSSILKQNIFYPQKIFNILKSKFENKYIDKYTVS